MSATKRATTLVGRQLAPRIGQLAPGMTTTFLNERCLDHVISIVYDRNVDGQDQAARRAFESLLESLMAAGYWPYRLPTFAQGILAQGNPGYRALIARLKRTFDPQNLFANGRYTLEEPEVRSI